MNDRVAAINCTNCGGALPVHGGHRVRTLTCGYCGTVMDRHADYQILDQYKNLRRPHSPLKIGMKARIKGVEHTLIGMIEYQMREEGVTYRWVDFQLYSPTHGYGWITYNNGHFVFTYRVRAVPNPTNAWQRAPKTQVHALGRTFKVYESYKARISYVEGELTWIAKLGDEARLTEAVDPPYQFTYESAKNEVEYSLGEYLDHDAVRAAFGPDLKLSAAPPSDIHPAQPQTRRPLILALSRAGAIFAPIALVGTLATLVAGGGEIQRARVDDPRAGGVVPFTAASDGYLYQLSLETPVSNSWAYLEVDLSLNGEDVEIGSLGRDIEYYFGRDADGSWSEGSQTATATFHVPQAGDYELDVRLVEAESATSNLPVTVTVRENVFVTRYFAALLIVATIAAISGPALSYMHERRRWQPVTGDDDDD